MQAKTNILVHETFERKIDDIQSFGFKSASNTVEKPDIEYKNGNYYIPETTPIGMGRSYAAKLINYHLEQNRPEKYPPRTPAIWFFNNWPGETQLNRNVILTVDTEAICQDKTLYEADYTIANTLFTEAMESARTKGYIDATHITTYCSEYWKSAREISHHSDLSSITTEVYIPTETLSPKYITNKKSIEPHPSDNSISVS